MKKLSLIISIILVFYGQSFALEWSNGSEGGSGTGDVVISGSPSQYEWTSWVDGTHIKGTALGASKVACSDGSGDPVACTNLTDTNYWAIPDPVIGDPDTWTLTAANYKSGRLIASASGTFALDYDVVSGMGFSLSVDDGASVTVNRHGASDTFILTNVVSGTQTQAADVTSIDITGPELCFFGFRSAGVWEVQCGANTVDGS